MSKQIEERVVSMQFDNKRFEQNVQTSMSTLDKLKQKLNLTGASKGLENVQAAAKKVDMSGLSTSVETVRTKFSALEVMGVTALANITNSAVNAGKRMISALTIAPVGDGFKEYEMLLNSIQTTMAGTGLTAEEVEKQLKSLDEYADKTVYSTADMLNNLPKFTNAGVKLETATTAMIGIANATALAGGDASKASIAFYNLGQAIGTGYLTRMDYNSINNAGIATMEWKEQMIEAALAAGTLKKAGDGMYEAGGKAFTIQQLFIDGLQHQWATTDVMLKVFGDYGDETTEIGKKSYAAAQDIKTFTMMMDSLKATAGTGWKDTWQIIFGDLSEAKKMWTGLTNFISGIITKMADVRNAILESAFGKGFSELGKKVKSIMDPIQNTAKAVKTATSAVKDYGKVVNEIIRGDWGNGKVRFDKLTEAGYDWAHAQNLVNERLGCSVRHATKYKEAQDDVTKSSEKLTKTDGKRLEQLIAMSDAELKTLGYTKKQIKAFRDLEKTAKKLGLPISEFIEKIDEIDGRWLLLEGFANIGRSLVGVFKAMKIAWQDIFNPKQESIIEKISKCLFDVLSAFHRFSRSLLLTDTETGKLNDNGEKLKRTFKGVFAIFDIIATILGGPLKLAFKIISQLLAAFNLNILDVTAYIGDAIVKFRDWLDSTLDFTDIFKKIVPYVEKAIDAVRGWFDAVQPLKKVAGIFRDIINAVSDFSKAMYNSDIVQSIIHGLANGLKSGAKMVWDAIKNLAKGMINTIKKILGIHSPSTEFQEVGENAIAGLANGLKNGFGTIVKIIKNLCSKMLGAFKDLDLSSISILFYNLFRLFPNIKILNPLSALISIIAVCGKDLMHGLANGMSQAAPAVWEAISSIASNLIETFKNILGIHSPSRVMMMIGGFIIAGLMLGLKDGASSVGEFFKDLGSNTINLMKIIAGKIVSFIRNLDFGTVFAIAATTGLLILAKKTIDAINMFGQAAKGFGKLASGVGNFFDALANRIQPQKTKFADIAKGVLKIAIAIAILAGSVYLLAQLDTAKMWWSVGAIAALAVVVGGLVFALSKLDMKDGLQLGKVTLILASISLSIGILAKALKILGSMDDAGLKRGYAAIAGLGIIIAALIWATKLAGPSVDKLGSTILKISISILLLVLITKIVAKLDPETMLKGLAFLTVFALFIRFLIKSTQSAGSNIKGLGGTIFKISLAILMLALVARIIGGMDVKSLTKGTIFMTIFAGIIVGLIHLVKIGNDKQIAKVGGTILAVGLAIMLMTAAVAILGKIDTATLFKGIIVVGVFAAIIAGLIYIIKKDGSAVEGVAKTLLMASIAIAILGATAIILGMIDTAKLAKGLVIVGILSLLVMGLIRATKGAQDCMKNLIVMTAAIVLLTGAIALLSLIDPERLISAGIALGSVLAAFALLIKFSGSLSNTKSMIGPMAMMIVVVGLLGAIMWGLSEIPMDNSVISKTLALSALMVALSVSLLLVSKTGNSIKNALTGILSLTAMVVPLAAFAAALAFMPTFPSHVEESLRVLVPVILAMTVLLAPLTLVGMAGWSALIGVLALTAMVVPLAAFAAALAFIPQIPKHAASTLQTLLPVMAVMTALLIPLTLIGLGMWSALIGVLALTAMVVPLAAFAAALAFMPKIPKHVPEQLRLILHAMIVMTALLIPLTLIGLLAPAALLGMAALSILMSFMIRFGVVASVIGAFMTWFPSLQEFLNKGIPVMEQLAYGLGSVIGHFISGISNKVMELLPKLGSCLSSFMLNAQYFIVGARMVNEQVLKGVGILAGAILALTAASFIQGMTAFMPLAPSFAELGLQLSAFMFGARGFIAGAMLITPEVAAGIKALGDAIMCITAANIIDGITRFIFGGGSAIETFSTQLPILGKGLKGFVTELGPLSDEQVGTASRAAQIIKTLAEAAKTLPNTGGLLGAIVGDNDMGPWGEQLPIIGKGIADFTNTLSEAKLSNSSVEIAKKAAEIVKVLAGAAAEIPNAGGLLAGLVGDNDFSKWGQELPKIGKGIVGFTTALVEGKITADSVEIAKKASEIVKALAGAASEIPNAGGLLAGLIGDNDLSSFATGLPKLGKGVSGFANELGEFGEGKLSTVNAAVKAVKVIATMSKEYGAIKDAGDFSGFGNGMVKLAKKIKEFSNELSDISTETVAAAVNKVKSVIKLASTVPETNVESCKTFGESLKTLAKKGVEGFVKEFTSDNPVSKIKKAAKSMLDAFIKGVEDKQDDVNKAFKTMAKTAATKIATKSIVNDFKSAGKDLGAGLVKGIEAKEDDVYDAAYKLGQIAVQGEKDGQKSKSPSRLTMLAGEWFGEGLAIGITRMSRVVYDSAYGLGETATGSISTAVSKISDIVNSDIDAQPTIRPVLDLSDVRAGAGSINALFSGRTLAVNMAGVGAVSASMAGRQNGRDSSDVVAAIKALRKDISDMPRNNYNINGITYDDGSNINEAVETLVRAARIERRT